MSRKTSHRADQQLMYIQRKVNIRQCRITIAIIIIIVLEYQYQNTEEYQQKKINSCINIHSTHYLTPLLFFSPVKSKNSGCFASLAAASALARCAVKSEVVLQMILLMRLIVFNYFYIHFSLSFILIVISRRFNYQQFYNLYCIINQLWLQASSDRQNAVKGGY